MDRFSTHAPQLLTDDAGRLFEARVREFASRTRGSKRSQRSIEALGALGRASHQVHRLMERWAGRHQLSEGRARLLFLLRERERTQGDLADRLGVSPRNITGLVDHLEQDGLVERVADARDRRVSWVRLTDAGELMMARVFKEMRGAEETLLRDFSDEELEVLRDLCLRLLRNTKPMTEEGGTE